MNTLLDSEATECIFIDEVTVPDGEGGTKPGFQDGAKFMATISLDDSIEARAAQQQGVKNVYTIVTRQNVFLPFGKYLRRISDGKIFRITSDGADNKTPSISPMSLRSVSAEETKLPGGVV